MNYLCRNFGVANGSELPRTPLRAARRWMSTSERRTRLGRIRGDATRLRRSLVRGSRPPSAPPPPLRPLPRLAHRAKGFTVCDKNSASAPISSPPSSVLLKGFGAWLVHHTTSSSITLFLARRNALGPARSTTRRTLWLGVTGSLSSASALLRIGVWNPLLRSTAGSSRSHGARTAPARGGGTGEVGQDPTPHDAARRSDVVALTASARGRLPAALLARPARRHPSKARRGRAAAFRRPCPPGARARPAPARCRPSPPARRSEGRGCRCRDRG
jgi:hypothetical protein